LTLWGRERPKEEIRSVSRPSFGSLLFPFPLGFLSSHTRISKRKGSSLNGRDLGKRGRFQTNKLRFGSWIRKEGRKEERKEGRGRGEGKGITFGLHTSHEHVRGETSFRLLESISFTYLITLNTPCIVTDLLTNHGEKHSGKVRPFLTRDSFYYFQSERKKPKGEAKSQGKASRSKEENEGKGFERFKGVEALRRAEGWEGSKESKGFKGTSREGESREERKEQCREEGGGREKIPLRRLSLSL